MSIDDEIVSRHVLEAMLNCFEDLAKICSRYGRSRAMAYKIMRNVINSEHVSAYFSAETSTAVGDPTPLFDRLQRDITLE